MLLLPRPSDYVERRSDGYEVSLAWVQAELCSRTAQCFSSNHMWHAGAGA